MEPPGQECLVGSGILISRKYTELMKILRRMLIVLFLLFTAGLRISGDFGELSESYISSNLCSILSSNRVESYGVEPSALFHVAEIVSLFFSTSGTLLVLVGVDVVCDCVFCNSRI